MTTQLELTQQIRRYFNNPDADVFFSEYEMIIVITSKHQIYIYDIDSDDDAMYFRHITTYSTRDTIVVQYPELEQP